MGKIIYALARGVFVGLIILGLLWVGRGAFAKKPTRATKPVATLESPAPAENEIAPPAAAPGSPTKETPSPETPKPIAAATEATPPPTPASPEPTMAATEAKTPPASADLPAKAEAPALLPAPEPVPPTAARTTVVLTKPIQITLPFGKISVPAGTTVKIVSQNGAALTVQYLEHVVTIPASSTDLGTEPAPAGAPEPGPATPKAAEL